MVAVSDGRVTAIGTSKRLGRFVKLQDVYGNTYTYAHLGKVSKRYPAPKEQKVSKREIQKELQLPARTCRRPSRPSGSTGPGRAHAQEERRCASPPRPSTSGRPHRRAHPVDRQGRQAAPVRQPAPHERGRGRRRPAGVRAHGPDRRRRDLPGLLQPRLRARPQRRPAEAQEGLARRRRHDPRPHRQDAGATRPRTRCSRSARPAAAPRGSTRSRSSTAGSCSSRRRSTAPRARTRSSAPTPTPRRSARSC